MVIIEHVETTDVNRKTCIFMIYLMYWIYLTSFIYVIHLMCWNYLIDLITHSRNRNNSGDGDNKGARALRARVPLMQ